jgi:hypothetical protein
LSVLRSVFNRTIYRDKKVVGVFCAFSCILHTDGFKTKEDEEQFYWEHHSGKKSDHFI